RSSSGGSGSRAAASATSQTRAACGGGSGKPRPIRSRRAVSFAAAAALSRSPAAGAATSDKIDRPAVGGPADDFDVPLAAAGRANALLVGLRGGSVDRDLYLEDRNDRGALAEAHDQRRRCAAGEVPGLEPGAIAGDRRPGRGKGLHRHLGDPL